MLTKKCSSCKRELPLSKFWKKKQAKDGYFHICIECYNARYYSKNKNTQYHRKSRATKKKRYSDWGGIILRDKSCKQCSKYRKTCLINFDVITTDFGNTCKKFSAP